MVGLFIVGYLRDQGYAVVETDTGEEALALLHVERQPPIRVVFTDIQLAGSLTGWDVAEAARKADPEVHVIYTSGNTTNLSRKVEGSRFFPKPYDLDQVVAACHEFVEHNSLH